MKLPVLVFLIVVVVNVSDCRQTNSWLPNIVDVVTNKTSEIKNYVRDKGRSLKDNVVNVKNKLTSYFGFYAADYDKSDSPNDPKLRRKIFKDYIDKAKRDNSKVFDAIAPETITYSCSDDDPTVYMTTPQLIAFHGYPAESHTVVTDDGYILTVHRIPYPRNSTSKLAPRKTVLLHHGLLGSSADWIIPGPKKGLAYILSDFGYDVWMANVRGNIYSKAHVSLNVDSFDFWNFTFHEVSQHDLPAVIDYIMDRKGWDVKINYIGHSMGTTVLFALLSTKTHYNKVLRAGFALAPVAYMTDIKSPIRLLAKYSNNLEFLLKLLGANEFLPQNSVLRWLSKHACEINHYEEVLCENSLFVICGHDEKQFNKTLLPLILGHVPAGASTKTLIHYAQEIKESGRFQQFDYGPIDNLKYYRTVAPPEYPVYKITLPIALISSKNDWLSSDIDVSNLYVRLANPIEHYIVPMKEFNHIDFLWGIDAPTLVYAKLIQLLEEGVTNPRTETNILNISSINR